jgi:CHAT domain-containing protein
LGNAYYSLGEYQKAIDFHQQWLAIAREIGDRAGEGLALSNIGYLLNTLGQTELAITFFKQSVNVREGIRTSIRGLSQDLQQSYTETIASTYRKLADLLLSQGRVLEAQQALELLKLQELQDYTLDTRSDNAPQEIALNRSEAEVVPPHTNLIALGLKLTECEGQRPYCAERPQLQAQRDAANAEFNHKADQLRAQTRSQQSVDPARLDTQELSLAAAKIVQAQPGTLLIYPLVLEDKLWLVWGAAAGKKGVVFQSQEIKVTQKELAAKVLEFRELLANRHSDLRQLQAVSQTLYGWLIQPIQADLDQNKITNLVFSLDRVTRYIPVAALFDGQQYLLERFNLSTILTAGLTDVQDRLSPNLDDNEIVALGLSNALPPFSALFNVPLEIDAVVQQAHPEDQGIFPGVEIMNQAFDFDALADNLLDRRILHIATHGKFVPGRPENSFLMLGTGEKLEIPKIKTLVDLSGIHLVVLSACETALGGADSEGIEMAGLSYYFLSTGAKSVLASLWQVNDASTSQLMQLFYQNLATGKMTKIEALRQAQRALITGDYRPGQRERAEFDLISQRPQSPAEGGRRLSHPYYWAPFILIGNGL